jgi:hypothetical protein
MTQQISDTPAKEIFRFGYRWGVRRKLKLINMEGVA